MNRTRKQHTVPRCYLCGFANETGKFFAFDKATDRSFPTRITDAAQEAFFYDFPPEAFKGKPADLQIVEKMLAELESIYAPMLADLLRAADEGKFSHELIEEFAPFVVLQFTRTKCYRDSLHEIESKVGQDFVNQLAELNFPGSKFKLTVGKANLPLVHAQGLFDHERTKKMARTLDRHIWTIGLNRAGKPFFTSDNPVVRRANVSGPAMYGADARGVEFAFPLDNTHLLLILERSYFAGWKNHDNRSFELTPSQVDDYNSLQVMRSSQRLYCIDDDFDLARRVCAEHPIVRDPNRPRVEVASTPVENMRSITYVRALE